MKKYAVVIVCMLTLVISLYSTKSLTEPITLYQEPHFKDKARVVNFWATWCAACKVELKEFEELSKKYPEVNLVLINLDSDFAKGEAYLKLMHKFGPNMITVHDPSYALAEKYKLDAFPSTLLVDKENKVIRTQRGFDEKSSKSAEIFIEASRLVSP